MTKAKHHIWIAQGSHYLKKLVPKSTRDSEISTRKVHAICVKIPNDSMRKGKDKKLVHFLAAKISEEVAEWRGLWLKILERSGDEE